MDRLESLSSTLSQITMYDIKSMYNQAKNVVLNVSEMEAKVREATNDEAWGASSTLMQEIAQGTFNFQNFNEIMPCIYARFMEKEARQWRQIYKALQLLEYLIKHGSERVVDDARSHISTIKMLRNFHYIDDKGKDEGINVRNRSRELVETLSDVEKIRTERRKAKANRHKYVGTGNDAGLNFSTGGSRYGGFGSDSLGGGSYGGGSSGYSGNGGGYERDYSGGGSGGFRDESSRRGFEEYNAGDDEAPTRRSNSMSYRSSGASPRRSNTASSAPAPKAKEPAKEVDLLGFGDDDAFSSPPALSTDKALPVLDALNSNDGAGEDDFADFQAAPTSPPSHKATLMEMLNSAPPPTTVSRPHMHSATASFSQSSPQAPMQPAAFNNANNNGFGMLSPTSNRQSFASSTTAPTQTLFGGGQASMTLTSPPPRSPPGTGASKPSSNFDDLWSMSLGASSTANRNSGVGKSIKDLEKEKAQAGIWGAQKPAGGLGSNFGSGFGAGAFGGASTGTNTGAATSTSGAAGGDDLLL